MKQPIARREDAPAISDPVLRMSAVESSFTLADITDTDRFRKLGAVAGDRTRTANSLARSSVPASSSGRTA